MVTCVPGLEESPMKMRILLPAIMAVALLSFAAASQAQAFGLLSRMSGGGCGCEPACGCEPVCAAPVCEPSCCAPVADCGCEPVCAPACGPRRGLLHGLFSRLHAPSCCEPACGCEPACAAPAPVCGCEPVCAAPAPVCGCEPVCAPRCGIKFKRPHLLRNLLNRCSAPACAPVCEPACGCEPVCGM